MSRKLPKIETKKLNTQVYDLLLEFIIDGKLKVGEMLSSERVLSEELGVSRTVLREAIKSLETRDVLSAIHGKGIMVNPATSADISHAFMLYLKRKGKQVDFENLVELRCFLEPNIARLAAAKASETDIEKLEEILNTMKGYENDVELFYKMDLEYHLEIARITGNILIITIMEALIKPIRESLMVIGSSDIEQVFEDHYKIYECIKAKDEEAVEAAMLKSIKYSQHLMGKRNT